MILIILLIAGVYAVKHHDDTQSLMLCIAATIVAIAAWIGTAPGFE